MDKDLLTIPDFLRNKKNLAAEKKQQAKTSPDEGQSRSNWRRKTASRWRVLAVANVELRGDASRRPS